MKKENGDYLIDEEKQREEKRKYTETFSKEIEKERERIRSLENEKRREEYKKRKKVNKALDAYNKQTILVEPQENDISNEKKTLLEYLKEKIIKVLKGKTNSLNNVNVKEVATREEFVNGLKPDTMLQQTPTQTNLKDEKEIEK